MAQYKYKATDKKGKRIKGVMNAADETELQQRLHEQDAFLISAKETGRNRFSRQLKPKVLADFSRQLSMLISAGVTLVRAINIIAAGESVKPKERAIYNDILKQLRQGIPLSDAMEAQNGAFPTLMIYMYRSAESSGNIDQVTMQMAEHYEKTHRLEAKLSSSMTYPKILGVMILGVIIIITKYILPQFADLFNMMPELPASTRILMGFSNFIQDYWIGVIIGAVLLVVLIKAILMNRKARVVWSRAKIKVPMFGKLNKTICTSRFARTLSSLYAAGIPVVSCLQIARKTIGNDYMDDQFDKIIPFVRAGNNLSDGLDMADGFVHKMTDSIRVGEETGQLDNMLRSTADSLEYDADIAISKLVSYVEPLMLIIMGIIVAFVLVSVLSAMYGSYSAIGGM